MSTKNVVFKLDEKIHKQLKYMALERDTTVRAILTNYILDGMEREKDAKKEQMP